MPRSDTSTAPQNLLSVEQRKRLYYTGCFHDKIPGASRKRLPQFGWYKEGGFDCAHPIYHYIFKLIFLQFVQANIRTYDNSSKASESPHKLNAHTFLPSIKLLEIKNRQPRHCSTS